MSSFLILLSIYITNMFSPTVLILLCVFMISLSAMYLNVKKIKYREVLSVNCPNNIKGVIVISISVFFAAILSQVLKHVFKIARPSSMFVMESGYSFPSGHASLICAFSFAAVFILFRYFKDHNRKYIIHLHAILFLTIALLVSGTRVLLQVHRPIDISGGIFVGLVSAYLSVKMYYNITKYADFKIFK